MRGRRGTSTHGTVEKPEASKMLGKSGAGERIRTVDLRITSLKRRVRACATKCRKVLFYAGFKPFVCRRVLVCAG
jgi:hypothetical protein